MQNKLDWYNSLCGKPMRPLDWVGGLVDTHRGFCFLAAHGFDSVVGGPHVTIVNLSPIPAHFSCVNDDGGHGFDPDSPGDTVPIFPPEGWAGKTDEELWTAVFGDRDWQYLYQGADPEDPGHNVQLFITRDRSFAVTSMSWPVTRLPLIIRCAQNALMLAKRFGWAKE